MALLTTTIGSYPKPPYAPVPAGFDGRTWIPTAHADHQVGVSTDRNVADIDRAVHEVVSEQAGLGIDVPTDGEIRREHYIYYHCRRLAGFDFTALVPRVMRDGGWSDLVPVTTGRVSAGDPFLVRDWQVAQAATDRPVKATIPGPLTILASTADGWYGDEQRRASDVADALNVEIRRLVAAGCRWIQVDEPVFVRDPALANEDGIELLARCFHGVAGGVQRIVHICCGYPSTLDEHDYPKADPDSYLLVADALDSAPVDAVSIEDAHRHNNLALLERFTRTTVILGVVDIASSRVETTEEITARLRAALEHIDAARLMVAPDCGLIMLGRELARAKQRRLVAAAGAVGGPATRH